MRYSTPVTYLLVGNYGVGNLGDDALREYFLQRFPQVQWQVVSARPLKGELPRFPGGIRSLLSFRWIKTFRALYKSDGMVLGGGSLFTDIESSRACFLWWVQVFFARLLRKNVVFAFQGVGPFRTKRGEWFARSATRMASVLFVRDPLSLERVQAWNTNKKVIQTFDPVFSLVQEQKVDLQSLKILIVIPRDNSDEAFAKRLETLLQSGRFEAVHVLSLRPESASEKKLCTALQQQLSIPSTVIPISTLDALAQEIARGSFVLTQRYHGAVVALALGLELDVVRQEEGDKLDVIAELIRTTPLHGRKEQLRLLVEEGESALKEIL